MFPKTQIICEFLTILKILFQQQIHLPLLCYNLLKITFVNILLLLTIIQFKKIFFRRWAISVEKM